MANESQRDNVYKVINTVLLSAISIFGVYSLILLSNVNSKLADIQTKQAVQDNKIINGEIRLTRIEDEIAKIKDGNTKIYRR